MIITHKHVLVIAPNNREAQTYAERLKATIEHCKVTETTTAVVIEWQELAAVTIKQEGQDERTDETG